jgi:hypothetical protein
MTLNAVTPDTAPVDAAAFEWLDVPVALCDSRGGLLAANVAMLRYAGLRPGHEARAAWLGRTLAEAIGCPPDESRAWMAAIEQGIDFSGLPLQATRSDGVVLLGTLGMRRAGDRRVLTLQPASEQATIDAQRLGLIRDFRQLGFFERDLRTGEGYWDPVVWSFWGLSPDASSPAYAEATMAIIPEDRPVGEQALAASKRTLGRFGQRFRVRGRDGVLRQVHSQWQVLPGADGLPERAVGFMRDDTETLRLAESATETDAQLRLAVELAGIGSWRHDRASGRVQQNDQGWAMLGLPPRADGLLAAEIRALVHPDDLPEVLRLSRIALRDKGPVDIGARYRRSDGQWRYVLMRCVAQRNLDGGVVALLGVSLDLTDRFAQSHREAELARRLEMATSAAGVGVWSFQPDPAEMHWDEQMKRLHGGADIEPATDLGDYLARHIHPDDREPVAEGLRTLMARRTGLLDLDFRVVRPDGTTRRVASRTAVETEGGRTTVYGVMLDVTERHEAEARLREADERVALATRGVGIGTWELSIDGTLVWWDDQMFRLRGVQPRGLPMRSEDVSSMVHPEDREMLRNLYQENQARGSSTTCDFRVVWPDGSVRWLASRSTVVRDDSGRALRRIGINWDVTDVRSTAAERQDKLLAQRESQAKSQFLARMSHELRTPLNAVLGFAQLLLSEGAAAGEQTTRERAQHIRSAGEHLLELIDEVLDLSSLESGELPTLSQALPLAPLVQDVLPLVQNLVARYDVQLEVQGLEGTVQADPRRLRQVLINLLSNALKYNRPGGRAWLTSRLDGDQVVLQVHDTGRGMSVQQMDRLFEPFNRLGAEREGIEGTGIGLAIVRAAVLHMGGSVTVTSQPDVGSCFEVRLPAAAGSQPAPAAPAAPAPADPVPDAAPSGVLYIEDNEVNMMIVAELLRRRSDLAFHEAGDGRSGIELARRHRPALILIDMQLPDMNGIEVLQRLRADPLLAASRCVALSANAMPTDIQRALDAGFHHYWTKPLDFAAFHAALEAQFGPAPSG